MASHPRRDSPTRSTCQTATCLAARSPRPQTRMLEAPRCQWRVQQNRRICSRRCGHRRTPPHRGRPAPHPRWCSRLSGLRSPSLPSLLRARLHLVRQWGRAIFAWQRLGVKVQMVRRQRYRPPRSPPRPLLQRRPSVADCRASGVHRRCAAGPRTRRGHGLRQPHRSTTRRTTESPLRRASRRRSSRMQGRPLKHCPRLQRKSGSGEWRNDVQPWCWSKVRQSTRPWPATLGVRRGP
mmetsp:Transcript_74725/g.194373  ORF Transcript_74725/g.194373 Transcript_74725/m.194373 type:complete len:237 (+) Transcript_74725:341-1051(+)